jgi:ADP-ribose pyrophosphatase YjhB (NUDIX family)
MKTKNKDVVVIVGRFQSEKSATEITKFIVDVVPTTSDVFVVLGLAHICPSRENPWDYETRKLMLFDKISSISPERANSVSIGYIKDVKHDDEWSTALDLLIRKSTKAYKGDVVIYGGEHTCLPFYKGELDIKPLSSDVYLNDGSTDKLGADIKGTREFRAGVKWAMEHRFPTAFATVDAAIMVHGKLLLGRKKYNDKYQFIGGFCDVGEQRETSVAREVKEETGINQLKGIEYIGSFPIQDWRYRNSTDGITTSFYLVEYVSGNIQANDDIEEVKLFDLDDLKPEDIIPEHGILFAALSYKLKL